MPNIVTFAEHREGKLRRPSLEAVGEARRLADALEASVHAVVVGSAVEGLASELGAHGADTVHVFDQPELASYATEPYARAVAQVIAAEKPAVVLQVSEGKFKYVATVSRPWDNPNWKGETGRVDDLLRKYTDGWGLRPDTTTAYLCGHPKMIENCRGILERAGWKKDAILEEAYFPLAIKEAAGGA